MDICNEDIKFLKRFIELPHSRFMFLHLEDSQGHSSVNSLRY